MKTKMLLAASLLLLVSVFSANAQIRSGRHQKAKIAAGINNGSINKAEAKHLIKEQRRLHRHTRRAKMNDGHIGPVERRHLKMEKRKADRHIFRAKHNRF